jgi:hypothetical protein
MVEREGKGKGGLGNWANVCVVYDLWESMEGELRCWGMVED